MSIPRLWYPTTRTQTFKPDDSFPLLFDQPVLQVLGAHPRMKKGLRFEVVKEHSALLVKKACESPLCSQLVALAELIRIATPGRLAELKGGLPGGLPLPTAMSLVACLFLRFVGGPLGVIAKYSEALDVSRCVDEVEMSTIR